MPNSALVSSILWRFSQLRDAVLVHETLFMYALIAAAIIVSLFFVYRLAYRLHRRFNERSQSLTQIRALVSAIQQLETIAKRQSQQIAALQVEVQRIPEGFAAERLATQKSGNQNEAAPTGFSTGHTSVLREALSRMREDMNGELSDKRGRLSG